MASGDVRMLHILRNSGLRKVAEGRYVRFRSMENVIAEIKDVVTRYSQICLFK